MGALAIVFGPFCTLGVAISICTLGTDVAPCTLGAGIVIRALGVGFATCELGFGCCSAGGLVVLSKVTVFVVSSVVVATRILFNNSSNFCSASHSTAPFVFLHSFSACVNGLPAMDGRDRPLFYELRWRVFTCRIFIRSQS
jgi:hypothetical protein